MRIPIAILLAAAAVPANATPLFTSRSASDAIAANCPNGPLGGVCDPNHVIGSNSFPGYAGIEDYHPTDFGLVTSSYARLVSPGQTLSNGSGIAYTFFEQPGDLLPVLRAGAFTRPNALGRYATSYSFVSTLAAFDYNGPAVALPLVGNVDFNLSFAPINFAMPGAPGSFPYSYAQLRGKLVIGTADLYQGVPLLDSALACGAAGVLASASSTIGLSGYYSGGGVHPLTMTLDASQGCDGNPLTLHPGQQFYVYGFLEALALQGGFADATNSFHFNLAPGTPDAVRDTLISGLTAVNSVPEPGVWGMLVTGFGVVGGAMRRRRSVPA